MKTHVRSNGRYRLADELEEFAAHKTAQGKWERAYAARVAAGKLLAGAESVKFELTEYRVGEPDWYTVEALPRDEVLAALRDGATGAAHFGSGKREDAYHLAIAAVEGGAERVRVGHLEYIVTCNAE